MTLDEMIKELIDVHEMSIPQFAEKTGLSAKTVRALLAPNRNPKLKTIFAVTKAFGIPPHYFFDDDMTPDLFSVIAIFCSSTPEKQKIIMDLIKSFADKKDKNT